MEEGPNVLGGSVLTDAVYTFCIWELLMNMILTPERSGQCVHVWDCCR
jgi:hypothetical protein